MTILPLIASFLVVGLDDGSVREVPTLAAPDLRPSSNALVLKRLPGDAALYAGVYEVTQGQWTKVMGDNPSFFTCPDRRELRPVESVSYDRACEFLRRLSRKTGLELSLPTRGEWEFACRAGSTGRFYADAPLAELARYWENGGRGTTRESGPAHGTAVVGSYRPNAWGLYDTLGNVREWCLGDAKCGTRKWALGGAWALPEKKCTAEFDYFPDRTSDAPTSGFRVFSHGRRLPPTNVSKQELWARFMDPPAEYAFTNEVRLIRKFDWPECDGELYLQRNGPKTFQRVLFTFPKGLKGKVPGLVVPYYTPEGMIARDFETGADIDGQLCVAMMRFAAARGWAAACGDTFHVTYIPELGIKDFRRWWIVSDEFNRDWPTWNCMGKKLFDIRLLTDLFVADARVDANRLGIAGHSLGGQSSFYSGFLDPRFCVVVASDFGVRFDQTHWESPWYWGDKLREARELGLDNMDLVRFGRGKPLCILSGKTDDETSGEVIRETGVYDGREDDFLFINHQTGHRPPPEVLKRAFDFIERAFRERQAK